MDHEYAFLRAILDAPDDDTPRLVFSDWLQERGDPWGEFLRAQCDRDGTHEDALLTRLWETTLRPIQPWVDPETVVFERGFIRALHIDVIRGLSLAGIADLAACPLLAPLLWTEELDTLVWGVIPPLSQVCHHSPDEVRLNFLWPIHEIGCRPEAAVIAAVRCPAVPPPTTLDLGFLDLDDPILEVIAASPRLAGLTTLDFGSDHDGDGYESNQITAAGVAALAASPHLGNVTRLSLLMCFRVGDAGVRALVASPHFPRLTDLDLSGTGLTDAGVRALAEAPFVARLRSLRLWNQWDLGDAGVAALAASPHLANLADLDLRGFRELEPNEVGDAGAEALAASPYLANLERLHAGYWRNATPAGYEVLRTRFGDRLVLPE